MVAVFECFWKHSDILEVVFRRKGLKKMEIRDITRERAHDFTFDEMYPYETDLEFCNVINIQFILLG